MLSIRDGRKENGMSESCVCVCPQYLQLLKESINYVLYYGGMLILVMGCCSLFQASLFTMSFLTSTDLLGDIFFLFFFFGVY